LPGECNDEVIVGRMPRSIELDRAVDLFLDHLKVERGLSPNTIDAYGRDLGRWGKFCAARGRQVADDVTGLDVADYLMGLASAGCRGAACATPR
jgi:integrase/recombinase XerD